MNATTAKQIIDTLRDYAEEAKNAAYTLERYDYREEAREWRNDSQPALLEAVHPTLRNISDRLTKFIANIPYKIDNLDKSLLLSEANIRAVANYLQCTRDTTLAAQVNTIEIEPMKAVADKFKALNLVSEHRRFNNIYEFAHGIRQWHRASKHNPCTQIQITLCLNYDEATPAEIAQDAGYKIFSDLFKPSCNYTSYQKRQLYNNLKKLYGKTSEIDEKTADKTVMAVILLFRHDRKYKTPFNATKIGYCKEKAFTSLSRTIQNAKSYSDNSLESAPKLGEDHVKRAESIIKASLENTK